MEAPATPTRGYFEWDDAWADIAHPDPVTPASSAAPATAPRSLFDSRAPAAPRTSKRLEFGFGTGPSSEPGGVLLSQAGQKHKRVRAAEAPPASVPSDPPEGVEEEQQPSVGEQATEQSQPQTPSGAESASGTATDEESVDEADGEATGGKGEQLAAQADSQPNMGSDSQPTISDWLNAKHADRRPKVKVAPRGGWWVVSLYDHSLQALRPWAEAGYKCVAFDWKHPEGKPTMDGGVERRHADLDDPATLEAIEEEFGAHTHFVSGFPPCNDLSKLDGPNRSRKSQKNPAYQHNAADRCSSLAEAIEKWPSKPRFYLENPETGALKKLWRGPDFDFDPCDYGGYLPKSDPKPSSGFPAMDAYKKRTGLWTGNGFRMPPHRKVKVDAAFKGVVSIGRGEGTKEADRSLTPRGFAIAVCIYNAADEDRQVYDMRPSSRQPSGGRPGAAARAAEVER